MSIFVNISLTVLKTLCLHFMDFRAGFRNKLLLDDKILFFFFFHYFF